jgi:hypothetical protein
MNARLVPLLLVAATLYAGPSPQAMPPDDSLKTESFVYALQDGDPQAADTLRRITEMARNGDPSAMEGLEQIAELQRTMSVEKDGVGVTLPGGWRISPDPPFLDLTDKDEFGGISISSFRGVISLVLERPPYPYIERLREMLDGDLPDATSVDMPSLEGMTGHGTRRSAGPAAGYTLFLPDTPGLNDIRILYVIRSQPNPRRLAELDRILSSIRVTPVPALTDNEWREILDAVKARTGYTYEHLERYGTALIKVSIRPQPNTGDGVRLRLTFRRADGHWVEDESRVEKLSVPPG